MEKQDLPQELQNRIGSLMHDISLFAHELAGKAEVIIRIEHVSNVILRQGASMVGIMVGGDSVERALDPKIVADDLLKQTLASRKTDGK